MHGVIAGQGKGKVGYRARVSNAHLICPVLKREGDRQDFQKDILQVAAILQTQTVRMMSLYGCRLGFHT